MGFPTGISRDAKSKLFFCARVPGIQVNVFLLIQRDQGDRLGELVCHGFAAPFLSLSIGEIVEVSIGVGNLSVLAVREIHAFF